MQANNTAVFVACAALFAGVSQGVADDLPRLDSSQFGYKYEMNALPTAEDLDGSGAVDFTGGSDLSWLSLSGGAMTMNMSAGGQYLMSAATRGTAGDAWRVMDPTSATGGTGYTIETLVKIVSQETGVNYALNLQASTGDSTILNAMLNFSTAAIYWGSTLLTNVDTTVWHNYRIVREGSGDANRFSVYMDGALVRSGLGNGYDMNVNRVLIGSPGAAYKGKAQVAYLRMCRGAYAPPLPPQGKAAKKWSGAFPVQYNMVAGDTRFDGVTAGGTDWSGSTDNQSTIVQDGVLHITLPQGHMAYYLANADVWQNTIGPDTAYTAEFKVKIINRWENVQNNRDLVMNFMCGNPRDLALLYVGKNHVFWEPNGIGTVQALSTEDNTDGMHTFRIEYSGASQTGQPYTYTIWRDNVVIGTNLKGSVSYNSNSGFPNLLRFGVTSTSTHGGSFEVDYVRWTTDGAWQYRDAPKGLVLYVR